MNITVKFPLFRSATGVMNFAQKSPWRTFPWISNLTLPTTTLWLHSEYWILVQLTALRSAQYKSGWGKSHPQNWFGFCIDWELKVHYDLAGPASPRTGVTPGSGWHLYDSWEASRKEPEMRNEKFLFLLMSFHTQTPTLTCTCWRISRTGDWRGPEWVWSSPWCQ